MVIYDPRMHLSRSVSSGHGVVSETCIFLALIAHHRFGLGAMCLVLSLDVLFPMDSLCFTQRFN